jgi:Protein of unknown function VcgC/VcgE (DUF2780)
MELVQELTQQLGINQQQASGGLGMILKLAKQKLGGDFGQVAQHVPDAENLMNSAPQPQPATGTSGGGILGAVGGLLGGKPGSSLASAGGLAGGFQQLGLSPGIIGRFLPVVLNFFQQRGGDQTRNLLEHALA